MKCELKTKNVPLLERRERSKESEIEGRGRTEKGKRKAKETVSILA